MWIIAAGGAVEEAVHRRTGYQGGLFRHDVFIQCTGVLNWRVIQAALVLIGYKHMPRSNTIRCHVYLSKFRGTRSMAVCILIKQVNKYNPYGTFTPDDIGEA